MDKFNNLDVIYDKAESNNPRSRWKMYSKDKYVIHLHNAHKAGLHLDVRLGGISSKKLLDSFAIPKAVLPAKVGGKVLAVRVNPHGRYWLFLVSPSHPMTIPTGNYGAGNIEYIQGGDVYILGKGPDYFTIVILCQEKKCVMEGLYSFIRLKRDKKADNWILMKREFSDEDEKEFREVNNIK